MDRPIGRRMFLRTALAASVTASGAGFLWWHYTTARERQEVQGRPLASMGASS